MDSLSTRRFLRYAEYGLLVVIIGLIALFLLNRVQEVHKNAERMAVIGEINSLRAGVVAAQKFPGTNPVLLLQSPPRNYLGPVENPQERDIPPGSWFYRPDQGCLVYKAHYAHDFPFLEEPTRKLRFTLKRPDRLQQRHQGGILACNPDMCLTYIPQPR